jgi:hypothetical protein
MKAYEGVYNLRFLGLGTSWSPGRFTPLEIAFGTHWIRGWAGPRTGLDDVEKIFAPTGTRSLTPRPVQPVASRYTDCAIPAPSWAKPMDIKGVSIRRVMALVRL